MFKLVLGILLGLAGLAPTYGFDTTTFLMIAAGWCLGIGTRDILS